MKLRHIKHDEVDFLTTINFDSINELHTSLKLSFDNYPNEYLFYKDKLIEFWKNSIENKLFKIQQKILIICKNRDYNNESLKILNESQLEFDVYTTKIMDENFVVLPGVFSPKYFSDTKRFCEVIPIKNGEDILELGCGIGALSLCSLLKGAGSVFATDINPIAIKNTKLNAQLQGVDDRLIAKVGDVYDSVPDGKKFDTIIWNGPFLFTRNSNLSIIENSIFDNNYNSLRRTISEAKNYLKENGKLIIGFSTTIGRFDLFKKFINDAGGNFEVIFKMNECIGNPEGTNENFGKIDFELFEIKFS